MNPYMELPLLHQRFHNDNGRGSGSDLRAADVTSEAISIQAYRLIDRIEGWAGRLVQSYRLWRRTRLAVQDLARLDDRMLKDIGIDRSEIRSVVLEKVRADSQANDDQPVRVDRLISLPRRLPKAANTNRPPSHLESA